MRIALFAFLPSPRYVSLALPVPDSVDADLPHDAFQVLHLQLLRFKAGRRATEKLRTPITLPLEIDMGVYMQGSNEQYAFLSLRSDSSVPFAAPFLTTGWPTNWLALSSTTAEMLMWAITSLTSRIQCACLPLPSLSPVNSHDRVGVNSARTRGGSSMMSV